MTRYASYVFVISQLHDGAQAFRSAKTKLYAVVWNKTVCVRQLHGIRKGKAIPVQGWTGREGSRRWTLPEVLENRHMKVKRLSDLPTGRLYPPGDIPGTNLCERLSRSQGHSAVGRIMSRKNSNDTTGNRTRDLPACSSVPQPTALPRAPYVM